MKQKSSQRWSTAACFFLWCLMALSTTTKANIITEEAFFGLREPRIVGGVPSKGYPAFGSPARNPLCGCTLIHDDIALTAAHCRGSFLGNTIYFGGTMVDGQDALDSAVGIAEYPYPLFDYNAQRHDIMLIQLSHKIQNVAPAPWNPNRFNDPSDNAMVRTIGFGDTDPYRGRPSDLLLEIAVPVVNVNDCNSPEAYNNLIDDTTMICAGSLQQDSCTGDSGNPLLDATGVVVGVVSFGVQCGSAYHPGIYTRVSAYDEYIRSGICSLSDYPPCVCEGSCASSGGGATVPGVPDLIPADDDEEEVNNTNERGDDQGVIVITFAPPPTLAPQATTASPPMNDPIILEPIPDTPSQAPAASPNAIAESSSSSSWTRRQSYGALVMTALVSLVPLFVL